MKIHIANLPRETGEAIVREAFEKHGKVASVKLVMDKVTGRPSGFAFVEMSDETEAKAAVEKLHKAELNGAMITLKEVEEEEKTIHGFRPGRTPKGQGKGAGKGAHGFKSTGGAHGGVIRRGGQRGV